MRRTLFAFAPVLLLTGCAGGLGEPETVNVTVTEIVESPEDEADAEADAAPEEEPAADPESERSRNQNLMHRHRPAALCSTRRTKARSAGRAEPPLRGTTSGSAGRLRAILRLRSTHKP
mgnify:CR=1 FL=1